MEEKTQEVSEPLFSFNQPFYDNCNEVTTAAYMPSIQAPAHEMDTLKTVVKMYMSEQLKQTYTVIYEDQLLCFKLLGLKRC